MEKDAILSSDDYGRDLASVQALQRKHEGVERDLAALEEKVCYSYVALFRNPDPAKQMLFESKLLSGCCNVHLEYTSHE
jgi:hypothetical protein